MHPRTDHSSFTRANVWEDGKNGCQTIERASLFLGGGRQAADDAIAFAVGLSSIKRISEQVDLGEPFMFVHARTKASLESALPLLEKATAFQY